MMKMKNNRIRNIVTAIVLIGASVPVNAAVADSLTARHGVPQKNVSDGHLLGAVSSVDGDVLTDSYNTNLSNTLFGMMSGLFVSQANGNQDLTMPRFGDAVSGHSAPGAAFRS